jgi:CxxC-x17-CxxC domain-containing protein
MSQKEINFFGETTFREEKKRFGIKLQDRREHLYLIGKTGMGKTVLLKNMAAQDILNGQGLGFIDPHGEAAEALLDFVPSNRVNDVVYFNPADTEFPIAFNVMEQVMPTHRHLVASGLMGVFQKMWPDVWSARMEYILRNAILALLEYPGSTLLGINRLLADSDYRKKVLDKVTDPVVKSFWTQEFARYSERYEVEATAAIQNKIGQLISTPLIRNIVGQVKTSIDMRELMDGRKILIVNLSKGRVGEDVSRLLGSLIITKLQLAAMSRVEIPEEERKDFFLFVDEFQNFATSSFINVLSEARKYRLDLILAHQYITQMSEEVRDAVFGNVGTLVCFRVGAEDAEFLEKEFSPEFTAEDLVNLDRFNIYLRLMIDGLSGRPFSSKTLPPLNPLGKSLREKIIQNSRERYGTERAIVEEKISRWAEGMKIPVPTKMHEAVCANCGRHIKVPFKPQPDRPVYCESCLKKIKAGEKEEKLSLRQAIEETLDENSQPKVIQPGEIIKIYDSKSSKS